MYPRCILATQALVGWVPFQRSWHEQILCVLVFGKLALLLCLPMLGQESPNDQLQGKEQLMYEASVGP